MSHEYLAFIEWRRGSSIRTFDTSEFIVRDTSCIDDLVGGLQNAVKNGIAHSVVLPFVHLLSYAVSMA
jgi:hypothetical protein